MHSFTHYVETKGDAKSPALIFIHAFPLHSGMWDAIFDKAGQDYFAVRYDVRGFGKSPSPHYHFTVELWVEDLLALMDSLKIEQAKLCGLSMGGYIALRFAQKYPKRVSGLVLADTKSDADSNNAKMARAQWALEIPTKGLPSFVEDFVTRAVFDPAKWKETILRMGLQSRADAVIAGLIALAGRPDTTEALSSFAFPVTLIVGKDDKITPPDRSEAMHKLIPHSKLTILAQAGHLSALEQPDAFYAAIR